MFDKIKHVVAVYNDLYYIDTHVENSNLTLEEKKEVIKRYIDLSTAMALEYHFTRKHNKRCEEYSVKFNKFSEQLTAEEYNENKKDIENIKDNFKYILSSGVPSDILIELIKQK